MTAPKKPGSRSPCRLSASLILTSREFKQYRKWQSLYTALKATDQGYLPDAVEYDAFQTWLKKNDSGYFSDVFEDIHNHIQRAEPQSEPTVAAICRHTLHPALIGHGQSRCPVCTIDLHLTYVKVLARSLHSANGRPLPRTGTPSEKQEHVYLAWCQGKLCTLQQLGELEDLSKKESAWEQNHTDQISEEVRSATQALELYWSETAECRDPPAKRKARKAVAFADGTKFTPGRPTPYFLRNSPRYEPGKYTLLHQGCDYDEDAVSEDSEDYSCTRVIVLGDLDGSEDVSRDSKPLEDVGLDADDLAHDDDDRDWEDIDSDDEDECSERSSFSYDVDEEESFIVFSND